MKAMRVMVFAQAGKRESASSPGSRQALANGGLTRMKEQRDQKEDRQGEAGQPEQGGFQGSRFKISHREATIHCGFGSALAGLAFAVPGASSIGKQKRNSVHRTRDVTHRTASSARSGKVEEGAYFGFAL
jgi:hypothetical protein